MSVLLTSRSRAVGGATEIGGVTPRNCPAILPVYKRASEARKAFVRWVVDES